MSGSLPTDERAAFEAWASPNGYDLERRPAPYTSRDNRHGPYASALTESAWEAWEARSHV